MINLYQKKMPIVASTPEELDTDEWYENWPNFSPFELASDGQGPVGGDGSVRAWFLVLGQLQNLRSAFGGPLTITSAYRDPAYNAAIGGSPRSYHVEGSAYDISCRDTAMMRRLAHIAIEHDRLFPVEGFRLAEVGWYPRRHFIHLAWNVPGRNKPLTQWSEE